MNYARLSPLMLALTLAACGGGGGEGNNNPQNPVASGQETISQGMITGFGSVIVNGVHYDVGNQVEFDGESLNENDLKVGQFVRITGTVHANGKTGTALKLEGETQLVGPISSIDLSSGRLVALGKSIVLTNDTFYDDDIVLARLKVGDIIKVSSYTNSAGELVATRVDDEDDWKVGRSQLTGNLHSLDTQNRRFAINNTFIDYSGVNLQGFSLENGLKVRVQGDMSGDAFVATALRTSQLSFKNQVAAGKDIELSGVVTQLQAGVAFTLNGTRVLINARTEYDNGKAAELVEGAQVEVEGRLDANGNLLAEEIDLHHRAQITAKGQLSERDAASQTLLVNGIRFEVTATTSFNDRSQARVRYFDSEDLATGDWLWVRGYTLAATATTAERHIATRIERHNAGDASRWTLELEGPVEAVSNSSITLQGQEIAITSATRFDGFRNIDSFLAVALGLAVEVETRYVDGVLTAVEIERDDDHDWDGERDDDCDDNDGDDDDWDDDCVIR